MLKEIGGAVAFDASKVTAGFAFRETRATQN
jgi:hypothetical protein